MATIKSLQDLSSLTRDRMGSPTVEVLSPAIELPGIPLESWFWKHRFCRTYSGPLYNRESCMQSIILDLRWPQHNPCYTFPSAKTPLLSLQALTYSKPPQLRPYFLRATSSDLHTRSDLSVVCSLSSVALTTVGNSIFDFYLHPPLKIRSLKAAILFCPP